MADGKTFDIGASIKLENDKEFRDAVTGINKSIRTLDSELKLVSAQYEGNANSMEALSRKQEVLNRLLDEHKKKSEATKTALENAKAQRERLGETLEKTLQQFDQEREKLEEVKKIYGETSDEAKKQERVVAELEAGISKGNEQYDKAGNKVQEWQTKLNTAEAQVIKATSAVNRNAAYLQEAQEATDHCAQSIDRFGNAMQQAEEATDTFGDMVRANFTVKVAETIQDVLSEIGSGAYESATELKKAENQIEASTNLAGKALQDYKETLKDVYSNNYGDGIDDIAETMQKMKQNIGELNKADLQNVTESAITLRDTFDMDMDESIRGAKSLMYQFNLTAVEAFDMIGKGAKEGLNYTDELGDNVSEYAGNFAQAGYSASEYFQLLKNGSSNGAYNLDKVNDAINEVTNRLADGTIEGALSSFGTETQNAFLAWQNGSGTQKKVIDSIVQDIQNCTNEQEALTMAATAFGTMGEDSNLKFVQSLTSVGDTFDTVKGTMESIKNVKYDDINSQITELSRSIQMQIGDQIKNLLPYAKSGLKMVSENLVPIESGIVGLGTAIGVWKVLQNEAFRSAILSATAYITSLEGMTVATKIQTVANTALNAVMNANPMVLFASAAGVAAAALVALWATSDDIKTESEEQAGKVKQLTQEYKDLKKASDESREAFEETKNSAVTESESLQVMADKVYALAESGDAVGSSKTEILAYIDQLNEAIPGLNLAFDEQTGKLNMLKGTLDSYIDSMKQSAISDAYGEQMNDVAGRIAQANQNLTSAITEKAKAEERLKQIEEERNELLTDNEDLTGTAGARLGELNTEEALLRENIRESNKNIDQYNGYIKDAQDEQDQLGKEMEQTAKSMGLLTDETEANTKASKENVITAQEVTASTKTTKEALDDLKEKFKETKEEIRAGLEEKINLFDVFDGGDDLSVDTMATNMESQLEGIQKYKENLEKLKSVVGDTIAPEFMQYIEDMGLEGANLVKNLADSMDSEDAKAKLKKASDDYMSYLDESDAIAKAGAANKMALRAALGELGSTKADFSELKKSVKEAANSTAAGWSDLAERTKESLNETIKTARECGIQIPEGLADGIKSGTVSPEEAIAQLKGGIQGQFEYFSKLAKQAGITVPEGLKEGISQGGDAAVQAMQQLYEMLAGTQQQAEKTSQEAGKKNTQAVGTGAEQASGEVNQKVSSVMSQATTTAGSYSGSFQNVGYNMMSGVAIGMNSGSGLVYDKVQQILNEAKNRANKTTDSHSPSRVWRDQVGLHMPQGAAEGITKGKQDVTDAVVDMAESALTAAQETLEIHSPSKKFRKAVGKEIPAGVTLGIKDGTGTAKKKAKEFAREVFESARDHLNDLQKNNANSMNTTLADINWYWDKILKRSKKKGKKYYAAMKKLVKEEKKALKQQRISEGLSAQESALDAYKVYYGVSSKAEMQYWDAARKKYEEGTDQRLEADKKYYEAKADYTDKLKELEDDYKDKCKETNEKLEEDLKEIQEKYDETLTERKKAIKDAFGLFDEFVSESDGPDTLLFNLQSQVKGYQMWVDQLAELEGKSILGDDFLTELREMGPDATATIVALNRMTEEQLKQAQKAYAEKNRIAEEQAARETESLKQETEKKLEAARETAAKELEKYKTDYMEACKKLSADMDDNLEKLASKAYKGGVNAVAGLIKGITDAVAAKDTDTELTRLEATFAESSSSSPKTKKNTKALTPAVSAAFEKAKSGTAKAAEYLGIKNTAEQLQNLIKATAKNMNLNTSSASTHTLRSNNVAKAKSIDSDILKNTERALTEIQKEVKSIKNMGIYLDGDLLAGRLADRIGSELANIAFNTR